MRITGTRAENIALAILGALCVPGLFVAACGAKATAKDLYQAQMSACVDQALTRAEAETCIHAIQGEWSEAGSAPALFPVKDGGAQ